METSLTMPQNFVKYCNNFLNLEQYFMKQTINKNSKCFIFNTNAEGSGDKVPSHGWDGPGLILICSSRVGDLSSLPHQISPKAYSASSTINTGTFLRVKSARVSCGHPPFPRVITENLWTIESGFSWWVFIAINT